MLATKLFAPARRSIAVPRPRLVEQLDASLAATQRLTLVSTPAGFGKSTALSDWIMHLRDGQSRARGAWLSLDEGDNDPVRLWYRCRRTTSMGS